MEAPEGTAALKRPIRIQGCWKLETRVKPGVIANEHTLLGEDVDLDGGVSARIKDLEDGHDRWLCSEDDIGDFDATEAH